MFLAPPHLHHMHYFCPISNSSCLFPLPFLVSQHCSIPPCFRHFFIGERCAFVLLMPDATIFFDGRCIQHIQHISVTPFWVQMVLFALISLGALEERESPRSLEEKSNKKKKRKQRYSFISLISSLCTLVPLGAHIDTLPSSASILHFCRPTSLDELHCRTGEYKD